MRGIPISNTSFRSPQNASHSHPSYTGWTIILFRSVVSTFMNQCNRARYRGHSISHSERMWSPWDLLIRSHTACRLQDGRMWVCEGRKEWGKRMVIQTDAYEFWKKGQQVKFINILHPKMKRILQGVHKLLCFSLQYWNFSELCQFCCSAGVLTALCVYKHWHRGKTEKGKSPEYFKIFKTKTQYFMHTLCVACAN